ncbi:MAG: type II secretion system F family protein [Methanobrevibacter sp.]|jgi:flagellar protein FlaJ|nr:type II secretion system F family protein [Methanobrevibacter sp.]
MTLNKINEKLKEIEKINEKINEKFCTKIIKKFINKKYLEKFNEILIFSGLNVKLSKLLFNLTMLTFLLLFLSIILSLLLNLNLILSILSSIFIPTISLMVFLQFKKEKRIEKIENSIPDFLRQIASMLRVGMGFENAMDELSKYENEPLYDEIKRSVTEIKMGESFENSIMKIPKRLKSLDLERSFKLILEGRKSGGNLADTIDSVAGDLRTVNQIKKERKSTVMMSVMFLIISAVIAAPFALGMVGVYSSFLNNLGKENPLVETGLIAASAYIIIHSTLVGFIIGTILYGKFLKGIKFSIALVISSYSIFYIISTFGSSFLSLNI